MHAGRGCAAERFGFQSLEVRMGGLRTTGRTVAAVGLAVGAAGCGDGLDPSRAVAAPVAEPSLAKNAATSAPAISDAISRILPAIDPASADALRGPLTAIAKQLTAGNATALGSAISAAREALVVSSAIDGDAPDLDAIALAIDSVDPALR